MTISDGILPKTVCVNWRICHVPLTVCTVRFYAFKWTSLTAVAYRIVDNSVSASIMMDMTQNSRVVVWRFFSSDFKIH